MSATPLVSVGLPFRNPGPLLAEAVRSVFAQTLQDWELILVDDGSTDASAEFAARIHDPRVRLIRDGRHAGLAERLNQIVQAAQGDYVARMDADDLMHPKRLELQVRYLQEHRDAEVVDTGYIVLDHRRRPVGTHGLQTPEVPRALEGLKRGALAHPTVCARRQWWLKHRYDPAYPRAEDRELFTRTYAGNRFAHIPQPLHFYFIPKRIKRGPFLQSYRSERKVLWRYGPRLVGWPRTLTLWARSILKSAALVLLVGTGREQVVIRHAFQPISEILRNEANHVLDRLRAQTIPVDAPVAAGYPGISPAQPQSSRAPQPAPKAAPFPTLTRCEYTDLFFGAGMDKSRDG
ncbi:MAG: glycosyltransferase family 2 protein [Thermoguttaceae bacterium]